MTDDAVLAEQLENYRARADEYDRRWVREGRFDRCPEANARCFAEATELERALARLDPRGDVLELACGTGLWTRRLVDYATHLTAVDAAPEVLAINRARVGDPTVTYMEAARSSSQRAHRCLHGRRPPPARRRPADHDSPPRRRPRVSDRQALL